VNSTSRVAFLAPAKLNIALEVFGKRPDGYHDIRSVMVPVSLYDEVAVQETGEGIAIAVEGDSVPADASNTCHKAARVFMERTGVPRGVRISVRKRIPAEAGLGGGSSDAAATFKGLMALTGVAPPGDELLSMAAAVGADVPFFMCGRPALVEGLGERVTPLSWAVPFCALIVKPPFGLSTREGYERLRREPGAPPHREAVPGFRSWDDLVSAVGNDFERAWADDRPEIDEIRRELLAAGAAAAGMTGSGSAIYGLYRDEEKAREAQGALSRKTGLHPGNGRRTFVVRNI
jgi:4-diphosphocytidyl-2-C-methyl-D-erythritol kinase